MKKNWVFVCLFCMMLPTIVRAQNDTSDRPLNHALVGSKFFLVDVDVKIKKLDTLLQRFPDPGKGKIGETFDMLRGEIAMTYLKAGNMAGTKEWQKRLRTNEGAIRSRLNVGAYQLGQDEKGNAAEVEASLRPYVDSVSKLFRKNGSAKDVYNQMMPVYIRSLLALNHQEKIAYHLQPLYVANKQTFPSDVRTRVMMKPEDYRITYNLSYDYGMALAATGKGRAAIDVLARLYLTGEEVSEKIQADIKAAGAKIPGGEAYFKHLTDSVRNYYQQKLNSFATHKLDVNGKPVDFKSLKGRYVLLDFWGSWCRPCRASHPHLKELYEKYKDKGFEIVGIATEHAKTAEERQKLLTTAIAEDGLTWIQVLNNVNADKFDATREYGVTAFPTKILLDQDGNVIGRYVGNGNGGGSFTTRLEQLLGK